MFPAARGYTEQPTTAAQAKVSSPLSAMGKGPGRRKTVRRRPIAVPPPLCTRE